MKTPLWTVEYGVKVSSGPTLYHVETRVRRVGAKTFHAAKRLIAKTKDLAYIGKARKVS